MDKITVYTDGSAMSNGRPGSGCGWACKLQIGHLDVLSLMYGMRITNNWLKMHGGIMARNGGKKKKRRLF